MRNIHICKGCDAFSLITPEEGTTMYQCNHDIDCEGFRSGPRPFPSVAVSPLPTNCACKAAQLTTGDGTVLADGVESIGVNQDEVQRFMTFCSGCKRFGSQYHPPANVMLLSCDLDPGPDPEDTEDFDMQHEQAEYLYGIAEAFVKRPPPDGCDFHDEQVECRASLQ